MRTVETVLAESLAEAGRELIGGDAVGAERRARAVSALARAKRELAELAALAPTPVTDDEELCVELHRRLIRFVEADLADAPHEVLERIATSGLIR